MRSVRIFIERDRVFLQSGVRQTLLGLRLIPNELACNGYNDE